MVEKKFKSYRYSYLWTKIYPFFKVLPQVLRKVLGGKPGALAEVLDLVFRSVKMWELFTFF